MDLQSMWICHSGSKLVPARDQLALRQWDREENVPLGQSLLYLRASRDLDGSATLPQRQHLECVENVLGRLTARGAEMVGAMVIGRPQRRGETTGARQRTTDSSRRVLSVTVPGVAFQSPKPLSRWPCSTLGLRCQRSRVAICCRDRRCIKLCGSRESGAKERCARVPVAWPVVRDLYTALILNIDLPALGWPR